MYRKCYTIITECDVAGCVPLFNINLNEWHLYYKTSPNCYILRKKDGYEYRFNFLYIHKFKMPLEHASVDVFNFMQNNSSPDNLLTVSDKLKWYRCQNNMLQKEVAEYVNIDRTTYSRYEENLIERYPLDKLQLIADLYQIYITQLLDEYNLFMYNNQGEQVKAKRKAGNLALSEFGKLYGVGRHAVERWENNIVFMNKSTWEIMFHK